jgi:2-polyprenyl-3-methyl-5-hydroxy-6-metoxy-1,4-benzoquinol methylase
MRPDQPESAASEAIQASWRANADAWTNAVRNGEIPGRELTSDAIFNLVRQVPSGPILDMGCGEGWLSRRLGDHGHNITGIDGSPELIARARELGGADFHVLSYADAVQTPRKLKGPYGTIVFNYSLLDEKVIHILMAVAATLFPYGRILIQTLHPFSAAVAGDYRDGWRTDTFPGFPEPIPYYFRTFTRWILEMRRAGLFLVETYEPLDPDTGRPVSLILSASIPERRKSLSR